MADQTTTADTAAATTAVLTAAPVAVPAAPVTPDDTVKPTVAAAPKPVRFPVTLDEFCRSHSKVIRGQVELLAAFHSVMNATGKTAPQTPDAWKAEFVAFQSSHKPI